MEGKALLVVTTVDAESKAQKLAGLMVEKRLAACAQVIGPIKSTYWWEGKIETATEWKCTFKTDQQHVTELMAMIEIEHPYDTPEVIAVPITHINPGYHSWLRDELKSND